MDIEALGYMDDWKRGMGTLTISREGQAPHTKL